MAEKQQRFISAPVALLVLVILFVAFVGGGLLVGATVAGQNSTSGLNTLSGYNAAGEVSDEWGLNASSHTWYAATMTLNKATGQITGTFPAHIKISEIIVQTKNSSQSASKLYGNDLVFTYQTFSLPSGYGNLTSAYLYFGYPVNATGTTALSDKGITGFVYNLTLYSGSVNNFGQTVQVPSNAMQQSDPGSMPQAVFYLNESSKANLTTGLTFTYTQYWQYTVAKPIAGLDPLTFDGIFALALIALGGFLLYRIIPVGYGKENSRVQMFQAKRERTWTMVAIALLLIMFVVIGWLGAASPLFGMGSAFALLAFGAMFAITYSSAPDSRKYSTEVGYLVLGGAVGVVVNLFTGFGTIAWNFLLNGNPLDAIAAMAYLIVTLPALYIGLQNTKRSHLKARYGKEPQVG